MAKESAAHPPPANRPPEGQRFRPGQSGNPSGRPKAVRELIELARESVPKAFGLAAKLMVNEDEDSRVRLEAAKFLTSYGIGAPPREVQLTGADGAPLFADLTDEQILAKYRANEERLAALGVR